MFTNTFLNAVRPQPPPPPHPAPRHLVAARAALADGVSSAEVANGQTWSTRVLRIRAGFRRALCSGTVTTAVNAPGELRARRDNFVAFRPPSFPPECDAWRSLPEQIARARREGRGGEVARENARESGTLDILR